MNFLSLDSFAQASPQAGLQEPVGTNKRKPHSCLENSKAVTLGRVWGLFLPYIIYLDAMATEIYEVPHRRELKMWIVLVWARGILSSTVCLPTVLLHGLHY